MDANKFMTGHSSGRICYKDCKDCGLVTVNGCAHLAYTNKPAAHHVITRADLFKKIYPNAPAHENGSLVLCPRYLDKDIKCSKGLYCYECQKDYWLKEAEEWLINTITSG